MTAESLLSGYDESIGTFALHLREYLFLQLPDPEKLLTGKGKVHRFVETGSTENLHNPALKNLLAEARSAHHIRHSRSQ